MDRHRIARALAPALFLCFAAPPLVGAQEPYRQPPAPIAQILDAAPTPSVSVGPRHDWLLLIERPGLPPIADVAAPELRLAGIRISPRTNGGSRDVNYTGLRLRAIDGSVERRIETPAGMEIADPRWSADGSMIAFTQVLDDGIVLWVADPATGAAHQVSDRKLNATLGAPCDWIGASMQMICRLIPANRGAAPRRDGVPAGPVVQEASGKPTPNRTYEDLLENPTDAASFEYYATDQLALVDMNGKVTTIGEPGIHSDASPSPDGKYFLVQTIHRPFSYVVTLRDFPTKIDILDASGRVVKQIADLPLQDDVSTAFDAVAPGPRSVNWRADAPATVVWIEALDGGDPKKDAKLRDKMVMLSAPFSAAPVTLAQTASRMRGVDWTGGDLALVTERWWRTRHTKTWAVKPSDPSSPRLIFDRSYEDSYDDPGSFEMTTTPSGTRVVLTTADGKSAYLSGRGASPKGDMPFLDRIDLTSGKTSRLWQSAAPYYESVIQVLDAGGKRVVTRRESVDDPPNYYLRDLGSKKMARLTNFKDPAPQFAGIAPKLITYTRDDGVQLSATLYLPADYDSTKGPLPFVFWAYPREFRSAAAAAQVQGSPYRFVRPSGSSHLFLLTQGYGVLDGPTMPIIGEGSARPNDSYIKQLVASAKAAVDKVVDMGVADRDRIAIGGHSYGAFMTANLLAHSDLFRAGIARSGAYNRSLTPFGFQSEERTYWQAQQVYLDMSPFNYADKINEPILLIHGEADNNSGTFPIQSERLFAAIKGNGGTVRYVVLPAEMHGYRARESVGHTLWEMVNWMNEYVKRPKQAAAIP
jgi:dipeptidyl aminopeptidase/acylaminoacyl peptidase